MFNRLIEKQHNMKKAFVSLKAVAIMCAILPLQLNPMQAGTAGKNTAMPTGNPVQDIATGIKDAVKGLSNSVQTIDRGTLQDLIATPTETTITVSSNNGDAAVTKTCYLFNEDFLNVTPTDNGSGANSIETTYSDEFDGNLISNILACKGDAGLAVKQVQIKFENYTTGVQSSSAISNCNPVLKTYNGDRSSLPQNIPLASTGNPMYLQSGFLIININFKLKRYSQFQIDLAKNMVGTIVLVYGN